MNNPIVGASVSISGTTLGTVSDAYGHFVISAPRSAMLHISCLGMKSVRTAVSSEVNVILNPEIIVIGIIPTKQICRWDCKEICAGSIGISVY